MEKKLLKFKFSVFFNKLFRYIFVIKYVPRKLRKKLMNNAEDKSTLELLKQISENQTQLSKNFDFVRSDLTEKINEVKSGLTEKINEVEKGLKEDVSNLKLENEKYYVKQNTILTQLAENDKDKERRIRDVEKNGGFIVTLKSVAASLVVGVVLYFIKVKS